MEENDNVVAELSASVIEQEVTSRSTGTADIVVLGSVGSTNTMLQEKLAINPLAVGQLVLCAAEHQTAGRGRRGKIWHTPRQGVTFSIAFSVDYAANELSGLSLLCGVAVCRSLHEIGVPALLKWPNDILVQESKLAGILVEIATSGNNVSTVIIGIGLNYRRGEEAHKIDQKSTDLSELLGDDLPERSRLIGRIAASVFDACRVDIPARVTRLVSYWGDYDALAGRPVSVESAGALQIGVADGIDTDGQLRVLTADGVLLVASGSVSMRPA